ncbi:MAG: RES family NAD+ phosphorylase [Fulvimonas sp.]|jgi:RES domain-containing protein|nr:RES family NAD+ phosphorylase [Fulvimonas sp.]
MRLWRISAWPGLTGEGGLQVDGRWHTRGRRVIYAAEHPALAMVEIMAHMRLGLANIPMILRLIAIDVHADATISSTPPLPEGWQANELTSQAMGNDWLDHCDALLMPVPSALIAHATHYLINPAHDQAASHLRETLIEPFWFDPRFLR